jgi:hypothetical protein
VFAETLARRKISDSSINVFGALSTNNKQFPWLPLTTDATTAVEAWSNLLFAVVVTRARLGPWAKNIVAFTCPRPSSTAVATTAARGAGMRGLAVALADIDIQDLGPLVGACAVDLTGCELVEDVAPLAGATTVVLAHCTRLVNVSQLSSVTTLNLRGCTQVTDVSALGRVRTLCLADCINVVDVSALTAVHTLDLTRCVNVVDVSSLGSCDTLTLSRCTRVTDVSGLGSVRILDLTNCRGVVDVSMLGGVHTLTLRGTSVVDVSRLTSVRLHQYRTLSCCIGFITELCSFTEVSHT